MFENELGPAVALADAIVGWDGNVLTPDMCVLLELLFMVRASYCHRGLSS